MIPFGPIRSQGSKEPPAYVVDPSATTFAYDPDGLADIDVEYSTSGDVVWKDSSTEGDPLLMIGTSATVVDWGDGSKALQSPNGTKYQGTHNLRRSGVSQSFTAFIVAQMDYQSGSTGLWGINSGNNTYGFDFFTANSYLYYTLGAGQATFSIRPIAGTPMVVAVQYSLSTGLRLQMHAHGYSSEVLTNGGTMANELSATAGAKPYVAGRQTGAQNGWARPIRNVLEYQYVCLADEVADEQVEILKTLSGVVTA